MDMSSGTLEYDGSKVQIQDQFIAKGTFRSKEEVRDFMSANIHFHAPGEHAIDGTLPDLEAHTVFTQAGRSYANYLVVGVMWVLDDSAKDDAFLTALNVGALTSSPSTQTVSNVPFKDFYSWASPKEKYNYLGSLTTPNCSENVEWFVVKEKRKINSSQLSAFTSKWADNSGFASGKGNNRILKPLGERQVYVTHGEKSKH